MAKILSIPRGDNQIVSNRHALSVVRASPYALYEDWRLLQAALHYKQERTLEAFNATERWHDVVFESGVYRDWVNDKLQTIYMPSPMPDFKVGKHLAKVEFDYSFSGEDNELGKPFSLVELVENVH